MVCNYNLRRYAKTEHFDPGSAFGIKEVHTVPEHERTMVYYTSARLDGLVQRHEAGRCRLNPMLKSPGFSF